MQTNAMEKKMFWKFLARPLYAMPSGLLPAKKRLNTMDATTIPTTNLGKRSQITLPEVFSTPLVPRRDQNSEIRNAATPISTF